MITVYTSFLSTLMRSIKLIFNATQIGIRDSNIYIEHNIMSTENSIGEII